MKIVKKRYVAPTITVDDIIMEDSIASGSATINTGWNSYGDENTPQETEWETGWNTNNDFDL